MPWSHSCNLIPFYQRPLCSTESGISSQRKSVHGMQMQCTIYLQARALSCFPQMSPTSLCPKRDRTPLQPRLARVDSLHARNLKQLMRRGVGQALPGVRQHRQHPDVHLLRRAADGPSPQLLMFVPFCASSVSEKGISCYSRSLLFSHGSYHMT